MIAVKNSIIRFSTVLRYLVVALGDGDDRERDMTTLEDITHLEVVGCKIYFLFFSKRFLRNLPMNQA